MSHAPFKDHYKVNKERRDKIRKAKYGVIKRAVIRYYTRDEFKCACCNEDQYDFFTVDHINNDCKEHRINEPSAGMIYNYLYKNGFPEGYQILCWNCNSSKNKNGLCIHQIIKEVKISN